MDPEIEAMSVIAEAMAQLDDPTRTRVIRWAADKFGVTVARQAPIPPQSGQKDDPEPQGAESSALVTNNHASFAELFSAAAPTSEMEKVLVAGYWFQEHEGHADLTSADLNKELKHLGHSILNINQKFDALMGTKPQLAIQLKKSGTAKQARKKYKITKAGIDKVNQMLRTSD